MLLQIVIKHRFCHPWTLTLGTVVIKSVSFVVIKFFQEVFPYVKWLREKAG